MINNYINLSFIQRVLFDLLNFKCIYVDNTFEILNEKDVHDSGCYIESNSIAIVHDKASGKNTGNYYLLINLDGYDIIEKDEEIELQELKQIDRMVKNRVLHIKLNVDLVEFDVVQPDRDKDEYGVFCSRYSVIYMNSFELNGMSVDYNKFNGVPYRTHNIYLDWDPADTSKQEQLKGLKRKSIIDHTKKNVTKKVNFKNTTMSANLLKLENKSSLDKIGELLNTTRRSTYRSGEQTSTGYGHYLVKMLEKSKADSVVREKLKLFVKGYEIISDYLKFNNETLQNLLIQNDKDMDGDIDKFEFLFLFKPIREKGLIDEETLEEFQMIMFNGKPELVYVDFKITLIIIEYIYAYKNKIMDKKDIREIDTDTMNFYVCEMIELIKNTESKKVITIFELYFFYRNNCDKMNTSLYKPFETAKGKKMAKCTFEDFRYILKKMDITIDKIYLQFLCHSFDEDGYFNYNDWVVSGYYSKVKVEVDYKKDKEYFDIAISKINLNFDDFPEQMRMYLGLSYLDYGSNFSIYDLRKICSEYKNVLNELEMQSVIKILDFNKRGYINLSDLIYYIYGMPDQSLKTIKDIGTFKFRVLFDKLIDEANFKRKTIYDTFRLEDTYNRGYFTKSEMRECFAKCFYTKTRIDEINHLIYAYGSLHQGNLVFDYKLLSDTIDTYYYLKYKKIPGVIETKTKKINMSPTKRTKPKSKSPDTKLMKKSILDNLKKTEEENRKSIMENDPIYVDPKEANQIEMENMKVRLKEIMQVEIDDIPISQLNHSRIFYEIAEYLVAWDIDMMYTFYSLDEYKEGTIKINQVKELVQGFKIEQNLESIHNFVLQQKYLLPNNNYNFKRFLDHLMLKLREYSKSDYHLSELFKYAKNIDLSDLSLFKLLGGGDDGYIDCDEFKECLTTNPKMYPFGSRLTQLEIRNLFTRMCCSEFDTNISYNKFKVLIYDLNNDVKGYKNKFVNRVGEMYIKSKAQYKIRYKSEFSLEDFLKQFSLDNYMVEIDELLLKLFNYDSLTLDNLNNMEFLISKQDDVHFETYKNIREILTGEFGPRIKITFMINHLMYNKSWPFYHHESSDFYNSWIKRMQSIRAHVEYEIRRDEKYSENPYDILDEFPQSFRHKSDFTRVKDFMRFVAEHSKYLKDVKIFYELRIYFNKIFEYKEYIPIRKLLDCLLDKDYEIEADLRYI
eukprot:Mrub_00218.p1 GENE.Mrub_00218~~Mrub_00218.p1  ORF type:complete len:1348 (+),score=202.26 Mrub_00218:497-4045(+)